LGIDKGKKFAVDISFCDCYAYYVKFIHTDPR